MKPELHYNVSIDEYWAIYNAWPEDVRSCIQALNNEERTHVSLIVGIGSLSIWGGNQGRVQVTYRTPPKSGSSQSGTLLDPEVKDSCEEFLLSLNGEESETNLQATVTKDTAVEVAVYVLKHNALPRGLLWHGEMTKYIHDNLV